jgi:signal transduction histidine kinase
MSFLLVTGLTLFSFNIYWLYSRYREDDFYLRLRQAALNLEQLIFTKGISAQQLQLVEALQEDPYARRQLIIYDSTGTVLFQTKGSVSHLTARRKADVFKKEVEFRNNGYERTLFASRNNPARRLLILEAAGYDVSGYAKQGKLRNTLIAGSLALILLQGLASGYFIRRDLSPLHRIVTHMRAFSSTSFHQRLSEASLPNEIGQLAGAFNDLLDRLEQAYRQQLNFVSYASHELRTPLSILLSNAQVTLLKPRTPPQYIQALESFEQDVNQMISLVNSLLELARLNAQAQSVAMAPVRVDEPLWAAADLLRQSQADYHITIDFETVTDSDQALSLKGNARLLTLAFKNLMENACKYSPDQKVQVLIGFSGHRIRIDFADGGMGMSAGEVEHIFDAFYRTERTEEKSGYGLGLPLVKRILEIHQGTLQVHSTVGKGSVFTVSLPSTPEVIPVI